MKMVNGKFMGKVIGTALAATLLLGSAGIVHADAWQMGLNDPTEGTSDSRVEQFVDRLYSVALNRAADVDGRAYWVDILSNQRESGSKVARGFIFSTEFISRDLDNEEFVETLYSVFFNRVATDDEIDNWVDALEAGASRSAVVNGFAASEEWANSCEAYGVTK